MEPSDFNMPNLRPAGSTQFAPGRGAQINTGFVDKVSATMDRNEARRQRMRKQQIDFLQTKFDNDTEDDLIIAKGKLSTSNGLNAIPEHKKQYETLQKSLDKKYQEVPEDFKPYVAETYKSKLSKYNQFAVPYTYGQTQKVTDEAYNTLAANKINDTVEGSADLDWLETEGLGQVASALQKKAERMGLTEEQAKFNVGAGVSETLRRSIEQQVKVGRLDLGKQTLLKFNDRLTPSDRVKAIGILDKAVKDEGTKTVMTKADRAWSLAAGNLVAADKLAMELADNDGEFKQIRLFLKDRALMESKQKKKTEEEILSSLNQNAAKGQPVDRKLLMQLPLEKREQFMTFHSRNRAAAAPVSDMKTYRQLMDTIMDNPVEGEKVNLWAYEHMLSPRDFALLQKRQEKLKTTENKEVAAAQRTNYKYVKGQVNEWLTANRIMNPITRGKYHMMMDEEYDRMLNTMTTATRKDLRAQVWKTLRERGSMKEERKEGWLWDSVRKVPPETLGPTGAEAEVHPSIPQTINRELQRRGRPALSEAQMNQHIQRLREAGVNLKDPR